MVVLHSCADHFMAMLCSCLSHFMVVLCSCANYFCHNLNSITQAVPYIAGPRLAFDWKASLALLCL